MQIRTQTLLHNVNRRQPGITDHEKAGHFVDALALKDAVEAYSDVLLKHDNKAEDLHADKGFVAVDGVRMGQYGGVCKGFGKYSQANDDATPTCESMLLVESTPRFKVGREIAVENDTTRYITKYFSEQGPGHSMEVVHDQRADTISLLRHDEVQGA